MLEVNPVVAQWILQSITRVLGTFAILQGLNIVFVNTSRWGASEYSIALMLPGAPPTWGVILFIAGAFILGGSLLARSRSIVIGAVIASGWHMFFAVALFIAAVLDISTSTVAGWSNLAFAIIYVLILAAYRQSRKFGEQSALRSDNT